MPTRGVGHCVLALRRPSLIELPFGSSNGGLLAATQGAQHPELLGAVVSDVPLADMLRYPERGIIG